ncbi:MAG: MFS transporter [Thermoproteota archaeon]
MASFYPLQRAVGCSGTLGRRGYSPREVWETAGSSSGGIPRNVVALLQFSLFRGIATGGFQALFTAYMKAEGYSFSSIGAAVTASSILAAAVAPGFGTVIDCYGAKLTSAATGALLAASLAVLLANPSYGVFLLSYALFMVAFSLGQPARATLLAKSVPPEKHGWYIGLTSTAFALARTIGPAAAGLIASVYGFKPAFGVLAVVAAAGVVLFYITAVETREARCGEVRKEAARAYRRLLSAPQGLRWLFLVVALDRAGWRLWFPMLSAYLYSMGYSEAEVGGLLSVMSLTQTVLTTIWGRLTERIGPHRLMALSEAFGAVAMAILASPVPALRAMAGMVIVGVSISAWVPGYNRTVAAIAREKLGEAYASSNAVRTFSSAFTPALGGAIYDSLGSIPLFSLSAVTVITAGMLATRLGRWISRSGSGGPTGPGGGQPDQGALVTGGYEERGSPCS